MNKIKGELVLKILEGVADGIGAASDVIFGILDSGYGASARRMEYNINKRAGKRLAGVADRQGRRVITNRYHSMIYRLKIDGLIEVSDDKAKFLKLTRKGFVKLGILRKRKKALLPDTCYLEGKRGSTVVIFDIPESDRKKRSWLREVLKNLNFKMAQKSVWIGETRISKTLLSDLARLGIIQYVEIFEVTKTGTLGIG